MPSVPVSCLVCSSYFKIQSLRHRLQLSAKLFLKQLVKICLHFCRDTPVWGIVWNLDLDFFLVLGKTGLRWEGDICTFLEFGPWRAGLWGTVQFQGPRSNPSLRVCFHFRINLSYVHSSYPSQVSLAQMKGHTVTKSCIVQVHTSIALVCHPKLLGAHMLLCTAENGAILYPPWTSQFEIKAPPHSF